MPLLRSLCGLIAALFLLGCSTPKGGKKLRLGTTTSVKDSGLLEELLPPFEKKSGYAVAVESVGSGKSLAMLASAAVDVAITHAPDEEQRAIESGKVGRRTPFMHNEFVIVGAKDHAAAVAGASDFREVLKKIASSGKKFVSRGDGSGTHLREQALWKAAGIASDAAFIIVAKKGMAETLAKASKEEAFALTDRSTFLAHRKDLDLAIVFQGDDELRNFYAVLLPATKTEGVNREGGQALADYLQSSDGRAVIGRFGIEKLGEPLFTPDG
jgi:tungstate transport system substrate-binding protein